MDTIRYDTLESKMNEARLAQYWMAMHAMGNTILLSSAPEANPWLSDMAKRIQWVSWTPTFPLLRERTLWLAACAARSAIAFGIDVVEKYLRVVSHATHPVRVFDALYGLSAIALEDADAARSVLAELRSLKGALKRRNRDETRTLDISVSEIAEAVFRAWGSAERPSSRLTLH